MPASFNLLEIAVYALVLSGPSAAPLECALKDRTRVACTNGLEAGLIRGGRVRFSNGVIVTKDDDGGLTFSDGTPVYWGISGWVHFGGDVAVQRLNKRSFRFSGGTVCRSEAPDRVACAPSP